MHSSTWVMFYLSYQLKEKRLLEREWVKWVDHLNGLKGHILLTHTVS